MSVDNVDGFLLLRWSRFEFRGYLRLRRAGAQASATLGRSRSPSPAIRARGSKKVVQFLKGLALPLLFGFLLTFGGLAGCSESILRDDYMGKSLLQPVDVSGAVERDDEGNPILD